MAVASTGAPAGSDHVPAKIPGLTSARSIVPCVAETSIGAPSRGLPSAETATRATGITVAASAGASARAAARWTWSVGGTFKSSGSPR